MSRRKAKRVLREKALNAVPVGSGGWSMLSSTAWDPSAWQTDDHRSVDTTLSNAAVFACITLIAADIGKLRPRLVALDDGIWTETFSAAFSPVLRKPNRFQNRIQFIEAWITSKLMRGNAYALKERDQRGVVSALYLLDPQRVTPLVAPDGAVFYQLNEDNLVGLDGAQVIVPASEIIHDRMNCLFHPLVGLSPLYAAAATAEQGLKIQKNSTAFFGNSSRPGGILVAPGPISPANAAVLKDHWNANYTGANAGRIAVLGDGMKFETMRMSAVESQLIEQLNMSAQVICAAFHVPPFMIGMGQEPTYSNGETRTSHYYSQCLQSLIEHIEEALDEGLGLLGSPKDGKTLGVDLDLSGLMRMDTKSQIEALAAGVKGGIMAPNEARRIINLPAVAGGNTVFMQQQNFSLEALANQPPPDSKPAAAPAPQPAETDPLEEAAKALTAQASEAIELQRAAGAEQLDRQAESARALQDAASQLAAERQAVDAAATSAVQSIAEAAEAAATAIETRAAAVAEQQAVAAVDAMTKQADAIQLLTSAVQAMQAERQAIDAASDELERKQLALDGSRDVAQALIRKFTGAKHDA